MSLYKNIALIFVAFLTSYACIAWSCSYNYTLVVCSLGFIISSYYLICRRRFKSIENIERIDVLKNLMAYVSITPVHITCESSKEVFSLMQKKEVHMIKKGAFSIQFSRKDFINIRMYLERIMNINLSAARMIDYIFGNIFKDNHVMSIKPIRILDVVLEVIQLHEEFQDKIKTNIQKNFVVNGSYFYLVCVLSHIINKGLINGMCVKIYYVDSFKLGVIFYENIPKFEQKEWFMLNSILENMGARLINNITGEVIIEFNHKIYPISCKSSE